MASAHTVVQGDTLYTIAQQNGFPNWRTIYDHASNAALRVLRPNPHVLHPGDIVQIPDVPKRPTLEVPLDARTAIVRVPLGQQLFRLLLVDDDRQPLTNTAFTLTFAGGGAIKLDVECLDAWLTDLSAPWATKNRPGHGLEEVG